ncbi:MULTISPECIES: T9SS type A sorting domain-containing protein [unclassified Chryseobacterium]|uniref:T9SS type A sorting domain-containing protein n=1 Tax=unclassified Chryseobacterium TaxID=2593645 RepID=UPI0022698395|nr:MULTISPECIES: T9SS type A sorting domain-containing protein [unclassified Chryseobacterium]
MKKTSLLFSLGFCAVMQVKAQYCQPTFQYGADSNMITNVTFESINKTSPFQSGSTPVYEDFTSLSTNVQTGSSYPISVKGPSSSFPSDVTVFIDFNKNGSFDDAGESFYIGRLASANPANAFTVTAQIAVPADAAIGTTRMRVLKNSNVAAYSEANAANSINSACQSLRSGQAEDYSLNITQGALSTIETQKNSVLRIFPNPTTDMVNIETKEKLEKYEIYNSSGRKVADGKENIINVSSISAGTYVIKIQTKNQKIITEKVIKK